MTDKKLDEKLDPSQGAGEYIKDFQKSDAPQFAGKSKEKRKVMALAAYLDAKRDMKEAVQKADIPAYLRKQKGEAPLKLSDLKRKDTISDKENLAKLRNEEVEELQEANHREFASQGKMHPDMAKHMKTGEHMDYYEPKTGDKVHGKVMKNDGKEVHVQQTHDSYDPKKKGTVHKFTISSKLEESLELEEGRMKDIATNAQETERLKKKDDVPFDGPYTKTKANVKDKSGAVHSAFSRAKHLARQAMNNVKEEAGQIDELSIGALKNYIKGAKSDVAAHKDQKSSAMDQGDHKTASDSVAAMLKRKEGIKNAKAKLNKEEVEELDELSSNTLRSYVQGAKDDVQNAKDERDSARSGGDGKGANDAYQRQKKRTSGIKQAKAKLNKEEVEELDEISLQTMQSAKDKLQDRAFDAHMDDNKYGAQHYAGRAVSMAKKIKQKQRQVNKEEVEQIEEGGQSYGSERPAFKVDTTVGKPKLTGRNVPAVQKVPGKKIDLSKLPNARVKSEEVEFEEQAPVAPVPDKKYIKGTPEHTAYKATKKPINGMPTNVKEDFENGEIETMSKSYKQFVEELNEIKMSDLPSRKVSGRSYGAQYHDPEGDDDADDKPKAKPAADAQKRGRGRPAGSKSGARQIGSAAKKRSGVEYTGYPLHLPNKN
jgi:hypothetical protein